MPVRMVPDWETVRRRTGLTAEDLRLVSSTTVFSGISIDELYSILIDAAVQEFPRNTLLFLQGDPARRFFVVLHGWVKVFRESADGRESVLHVFGAGESFAEAAIFEDKGYPASASACVDVRLLGIPSASFKALLAQNHVLAERFMLMMSQKLQILTRHIEQLAARSATERLAGFLCELCPEKSGSADVQLPLEKAVIAARLGMQPETFSRSMSKLRSIGVEISGDRVSIADVSALRGLGEGCALTNTSSWGEPSSKWIVRDRESLD